MSAAALRHASTESFSLSLNTNVTRLLAMKTHAFVVFQRRTLENEKTRLPTAKVLASLGEVTFLVASLHDRLLRDTNYVRHEERNYFILVLHGEGNQRAQILF